MMPVSGEAARRSGSASSPERPGIVMSSSNTSGRWLTELLDRVLGVGRFGGDDHVRFAFDQAA